jgi:hypothetical protein
MAVESRSMWPIKRSDWVRCTKAGVDPLRKLALGELGESTGKHGFIRDLRHGLPAAQAA